MHLITPSELNLICLDVLFWAKRNSPLFTWYFDLVYLTGCRPAEPLHFDRWSFGPDGRVYLLPLKSNVSRSFDSSDLPDLFVDSLLSNSPLAGLHRLKTMTRIMNRSNRFGVLYSGDDVTGLYLFRYNKVRQLYTAGFSMSQIQNYFGWNNEDMPNRYLTRALFLKYPPNF